MPGTNSVTSTSNVTISGLGCMICSALAHLDLHEPVLLAVGLGLAVAEARHEPPHLVVPHQLRLLLLHDALLRSELLPL